MPRTFENQPPTSNQRLPEYMRGDDWIRGFLQRGEIARIASRWDLQPFITPTTYFYDEAGHRIIFHSNITGRIRANIDRHPEVCVEISEMGKYLPSNVALEFSLQYRSVIVFGKARVIEDQNEQRQVLHKLIAKYFGKMKINQDCRAATDVVALRIDKDSFWQLLDERPGIAIEVMKVLVARYVPRDG